MSKKKKLEAKLKRDYEDNQKLMDDLFYGTIDYSAMVEEEEDNYSSLDIFTIEDDETDTSEETTEFGKMATNAIYGNISVQDNLSDEEDEEDYSEEIIYDEENPLQFSEIDSDENEKSNNLNKFYSFGVCDTINDNIYYITDDIKSIYVDLHTLEKDETDNEVLIDDFLDEILPNFYPSGIFSKTYLEDVLKGLTSIDTSKFRFIQDDNLVYAYYISDTCQESLEDLFDILYSSNIISSFANYIKTSSSMNGFSFNSLGTDYVMSLLNDPNYADSSMNLIKLIMEDDRTNIDKDSKENILDNIIINIGLIVNSDETDEEESESMINFDINKDEDNSTTDEDSENIDIIIPDDDKPEELLDNIEDVEEPVDLNEEHDSEAINEELIEVEEISEDSTEEVFDEDDIPEEYNRMLQNNRNYNKNNKNYNKHNNDESMVVPRHRKN